MQERITEGELVIAYKETFNSASGKIVLRHLMRNHSFLIPVHVDGDQQASAFNDGARNVVIQILRTLHTDEQIEDKTIEEGEDYEL